MAKYRLIFKDEGSYDNIVLGAVYDEDFIPEGWDKTIGYHAMCYPTEWEKVTDHSNRVRSISLKDAKKAGLLDENVFPTFNSPVQINTQHKDTDLGYFTGLAMQAFIHRKGVKREDIAELSVELAKEIIKRLKDEQA